MSAPRMRIDEALAEWATDRQKEVIKAINRTRSFSGAARELGVNLSVIQGAVRSMERKAAVYGYSPRHDLSRPVAPGQILRGASTLYRRGEAEPVLQWVKSRADDDQREAIMREAAAALMNDVPRAKRTPGPDHCSAALCNLITLTDTHVGMRAWGKETGADWDLQIAERTLIGAVEHLLLKSPRSDTCLISQLGDFLHQDGHQPVTPTSGHILDSDSRFSKIVGASVRILRRVIDCALSTHRMVYVLMGEGNHDVASSVWLRHMFKLLYEHEPRVSVIDSELPYYVHQHGKTMLAFHHGHLKKNDQLPLLFAAQFPQVWGLTTKRYAHTGHRHHVEEKEHSGMTVIQHPTIAARDAYAARGGWIAERQISSITYHAEYGQVARNTVTPEMLE